LALSLWACGGMVVHRGRCTWQSRPIYLMVARKQRDRQEEAKGTITPFQGTS
jgi:hypothetical protein